VKAQVNVREKPAQTGGLKRALLYCDLYGVKWAWWCPSCSEGKDFIIGNEWFATREGAMRSAKQHEKRRGH